MKPRLKEMSLCRGRKQRLSGPVVRPGLPPALLQGFVFLAGRVRIWAVSPPSPFKDLVSSEATWGTPWEVRRVIFPNQEARASPGADLPKAIVLTPVGRRGRSLRAAWGCGHAANSMPVGTQACGPRGQDSWDVRFGSAEPGRPANGFF